jgi:hypothetical protein
MRNNKINKILIMYLACLMVFSVPINGILAINKPLSSEGEGPIDFVVINPTSDTHLMGDFIDLDVTVQSPSGTWPEEVIACVWGNNITMQHVAVSKNGIPYSSNIIDGAPFECFIKNIDVSEIEIAFYARNATGEAKTASNLTVYMSEPEPILSLSADEVWNNAYNFELTISQYNFCDGINSAVVNLSLNGVNTTFSNPVYDHSNRWWKYTYFNNFGVDDDGNYFANASVFVEGKYYSSNTVNFKTSSLHTTIGAISARTVNYEDTNVAVDYLISISDSHDLQPLEVRLQINLDNTTIPLTRLELYDEYYSTPMAYCTGTHWSLSVVLDNLIVHYEYDTLYLVTLWINNGTWVNASYMELNYTHYDTPAYTLEVLNSTIYITGGNRYWNLTVNLTSQIASFRVPSITILMITYNYITVYCQHPAMQTGMTMKWLTEVNALDTDYTDGKLFCLQSLFIFNWHLIGPASDPWWGRMGYYFIVGANWDYGTVYPTTYPDTILESYDSGEDCAVGLYSVTPGNYTRSLTAIATTSCTQNSTYIEKIKIEIVAIGRIMGSDYIDIRNDYTSLASCNSNEYYGNIVYLRYAENLFAGGQPFSHAFTRFYVNPEDPTTYPKISVNGITFIVVIPTNCITYFDDYMNGTESGPGYIRSGSQLEWNYELVAGIGRFSYQYKFSNFGLIESFTNSEICGDYIVSNSLNVIVEGNLFLTILFILIAAIAVITGIITIRKARKPKRVSDDSNDSIDSNNSDSTEELPKTDLSANLKSKS